MSSEEALIYIAGVGAMIAALFALIQMIKETRKTQNHTINVQIPEEADEAIQKIAEAYRTLDKARTEHPLTETDVQAALLEARVIVAAHINTRISIVTSGIERLSKQRARDLGNGYKGPAESILESIRLLETELDELQAQLVRPELEAV